MPLIRTALNYRHYVVGPGPGNTIAVFTKDGHYKHMPFYGFVTLEGARKLAGAIPVKLDARAYTLDDDRFGRTWVDVPKSQVIQGCCFDKRVWAVLEDGVPRVVDRY